MPHHDATGGLRHGESELELQGGVAGIERHRWTAIVRPTSRCSVDRRSEALALCCSFLLENTNTPICEVIMRSDGRLIRGRFKSLDHIT